MKKLLEEMLNIVVGVLAGIFLAVVIVLFWGVFLAALIVTFLAIPILLEIGILVVYAIPLGLVAGIIGLGIITLMARLWKWLAKGLYL